MKKIERFFAFLMALLFVLPLITPLTVKAEEGAVARKITVVKGKDINDIQYDKRNVLHSSAWWYDDDGTKHPAFCVDPNLAGPGEIAAGQYEVNIAGAETNEKIAAILNNSIPYKTYQELGVDSEEEAYAATKAAIWCVIGVSNYTNKNLWDNSAKPKVKALFDKLVDLALNNPEPVKQAVYGSARVDKEPVKEGNWWYQRYKVVETTDSGKEIQKYQVKLTDAPNGTKITDESGTEKDTFNGDEFFKVWIPVSAIPEGGMAKANFEITADMLSNVILIGKPTSGLEGKVQDMEIAMPIQKVKIENNMIVADEEALTTDTPRITVEKYDEQTGERLPNAQFAIYEQDDMSRPVKEGMTDANGRLSTDKLEAGTYVVKELNPPKGYMVSDKTKAERVIVVEEDDGEIIVKVDNIKLPELTIKKVDAVTKEPIAGVTYRAALVDDTSVQPATAVTDASGVITLPELQAGTYEVTEISAPKDYIVNETPQRVKLEGGDEKTLLFENTKYPTLIVQKTDGTTNKGIANTTFKIEHENSDGTIETVGTFKTDVNGQIKLTNADPGWYILTETIPAQGYQKPTNPVTRMYLAPGDNSYLTEEYTNIVGDTGNTDGATYSITSGADYAVVGDIVNYPLNSIVIKKSDANTGEMLEGATFEVIRVTGETSGQNGTVVCTVTTDHSGVLVITGLEAGAYAIREIKAPQNYLIDETALQTVNLKADGTSVVEVTFRNYPYGSIHIQKTDGETKQPLEGAEFQVTESNGAFVGNYTTDANGEILIPNLKPGSYIVTETKAPDGYALSSGCAKTVVIGTDGKVQNLNFTNTKLPEGTLLIHKTDAETGDAIEGVTFEIRRENGELIATEETDKQGEITITGLEEGIYYVKETKEQEGYKADDTSHKVVLGESGYVKLEVENEPLSGLRLKKIDSVTGEGIYGVEFALYNKNGKIVGNYFTDNKGIIDFDAELPEGRYTIKEITPAEGYYADNTPRTVELRAGKITQITWENTPQAGQIKIKKVSGDYNETNALPKGTALQGAIFEIYNYKTGNVVDRIETDYYGIANSKPLPLGRYIIKEVQAPSYYKINPEEIDVTIEFATQIVSLTVEDYSANISAEIDKFGPYEVMPGQPAIYTIKNVRNSSTVPLTDFYWRDVIPTSAGTLDKIVTGTYNLQGRYKVVATTSYGNTIVLADNLDTAKNNVIQCAAAAVGLNSGEYITSVSLMFGTVQPGFTQVQEAKVYLTVKNSNLPNGYVFANKADVGGKYGEEWATSNATWTTTVYNPAAVKLPKTGW